jgi:mRNA interferase RelE/StbE
MPKIYVKKSVKNDFKQIDVNQQIRILEAIKESLTKDVYSGKPLKGKYEGLYSLRIGDYRVIYKIVSDGVLILAVGDRKDIYR